MINISHEVPLHLLSWSKTINDYDYCLPYFYKRYPEYKEFYLKWRDEGRMCILDNGLFEGETYTKLELIDLIDEIKPTIFVVPDEWNDYYETHKHAVEWAKVNTTTKLMVVLQGQSFEEMHHLYRWSYSLGYRYFAFNHSSEAYLHAFPHKNKDISRMMGRIKAINHFSKFLNNDVYIHLLGCSLPQEFAYYEGYDFIQSIDTSNPIICGAIGITYDNGSLFKKPKVKMEEIFESDHMPMINKIQYNVDEFRKILK